MKDYSPAFIYEIVEDEEAVGYLTEVIDASSMFNESSKKTYKAKSEFKDYSALNVKITNYVGNAVLNDSRVRLRTEPNLACKTLCYLTKGDAIKITDRSDEKYEIDGESWYWYKVESGSYPEGWVYGKYLDIE